MKAIMTEDAPQAIGAYSQAVYAGGAVYLAGQIALDPKSMNLCSENVVEQMEQVFKNLSAVCVAAGGSLAQIVKLTVYLTDLACFSAFNEVMSRYFDAPYPARAAIQVAALPRDAQVEVDGVMVLD